MAPAGLPRSLLAVALAWPQLVEARLGGSLPLCSTLPNYELARSWCGDQREPYACYKEADSHHPTWDCRVTDPKFCGVRACTWNENKVATPVTGLPLEPSCDHVNVGRPNCGEVSKCFGEYHGSGNSWTLRASSHDCSYVTFRTELSLQELVSIDADVFVTGGTCGKLDNLAFWFFQSTEDHNDVPQHMWDALSEVDMLETYIGPGAVNSVNTNFAATGVPVQWPNVTITGGVRKHVTMWQDFGNTMGCPKTRQSVVGPARISAGYELPVVSVYVAHCEPGVESCCPGGRCEELQGNDKPLVARACITVKEAPMLLVLSNWGANHHVTPGCEIGAHDIRVERRHAVNEMYP